MVNGIIGKKLGMTQIFAPDGSVTPVTVIKAGPCVVVQRKTVSTDGYEAVQLGWSKTKPKRTNKPMKGHFAKAGIPPTKVLREFRLEDATVEINVGDKVLVDQFTENDVVDVIGTSKGRGFAGFVKRHGFGGGRAHGSMFHRAPAPSALRPIRRASSKAREWRVTWASNRRRSEPSCHEGQLGREPAAGQRRHSRPDRRGCADQKESH